MSAKDELRNVIEAMSEEDAAALLPMADPSLLAWLDRTAKCTSTKELLEMPAAVRELIIRYELSFYTEEDAAQDLAEWELWEAGTGKDIHLIDG